MQPFIPSDVGPLQALIDELEFNHRVAEMDQKKEVGCHFRDKQFSKAIEYGSISILEDDLKNSINDAYATMGAANVFLSAAFSQPLTSRDNKVNSAIDEIKKSKPKIEKAKEELLKFLGKEL